MARQKQMKRSATPSRATRARRAQWAAEDEYTDMLVRRARDSVRSAHAAVQDAAEFIGRTANV